MTRVGHGFWRRFWRRQPVHGAASWQPCGRSWRPHGHSPPRQIRHGLAPSYGVSRDPNSGCWYPHRRCHRGVWYERRLVLLRRLWRRLPVRRPSPAQPSVAPVPVPAAYSWLKLSAGILVGCCGPWPLPAGSPQSASFFDTPHATGTPPLLTCWPWNLA